MQSRWTCYLQCSILTYFNVTYLVIVYFNHPWGGSEVWKDVLFDIEGMGMEHKSSEEVILGALVLPSQLT